MKLKLVPARMGFQWVRLGIRTFWRQPLALSALMVIFMVFMSVAGTVPLVGLGLALALLPAGTLGIMAASREADAGKFPRPLVFLSAFRAGRKELRAMLLLGVLYGAGYLLAMGIAALFDGGVFASRFLTGRMPTAEMAQEPATQTAMLVFMALHVPLSLMFWHAPALVHWHQVPAVKSIFFSLVACLRNIGAFALFVIAWMGILAAVMLVTSLLVGAIGDPQVAGIVLMAALMPIITMFFTSIYFSFRDCFETEPPAP